MRRTLAATAVCLAALSLATTADARRGRHHQDQAEYGPWVTIGAKLVNSRIDNDHVRVRGSERFRRVRLCAVNYPFELRSLAVHFHNGETQHFPYAATFVRAGSCTRPFDLEGRSRNLDDIYLTFAKVIRGSEPQVEIQAQ